MANKSKKRNAEKTPAVLRATLHATREQVAKLHEELVVRRVESELYHAAINCLQQLSQDHTCTSTFSKNDCLHCKAKLKLVKLVADYKGRRTQMPSGRWI